ncbi:hypothetical protein ACGFT2_14835 [Streptomyces sp. NPDC048514]|uniref:hypothetical protein n=1 Tax=Streptomyces sp. NPDC048514 TaxID=3365564 RepID=UPI003717DC06
MAITSTRRLVPLLIATTLASGGISLATPAFAATTAPTGVTTDTDDPGSSLAKTHGKHLKLKRAGATRTSLVKTYSKQRRLEEIRTHHGDTELLDKFSKIPIKDTPHQSDGNVQGADPNTATVDVPPYVASESRTDDARPGPIITDKATSGGNGSPDDARGGYTQPPGGNGSPDDARGGYTQPPTGNGSPDDARGGYTQPPTGQTSDGNAASSDPGPRQDIDYGGWTDPNPGPVVN